jgi:hypothetical protein
MRTQPGPRTALTVRIKIKNKEGRVVEEKEVVTYAGLLARAHEEGLRYIRTEIVNVPTKDYPVAIVSATVRTNKGTFTSIADATPSNVNAKIAPHYVRMAETRAKARALRDAVNVGMLSLEELGTLEEEVIEESPRVQSAGAPNGASPRPANDNGRGSGTSDGTPPPEFVPMSDAQRQRLFRIAGSRGIAQENTRHWLEAELGVPDLRALSRSAASQAITRLEQPAPSSGDGRQNGTHAPRDATT